MLWTVISLLGWRLGRGLGVLGMVAGLLGAVPALAQTPIVPLELKSLQMTAESVAGGRELVGVVTLTGRAPQQGMVVRLHSSDQGLAPVPASILVPRGRKSAAFVLLTQRVVEEKKITLTAVCGPTKTVTITLRLPGLASLVLAPESVTGGENAIGALRLEASASKDIDVELICDNPSITLEPAHVALKKGEMQATFSALTKAVSQKTTIHITAKTNSTSVSASLTITP